MSVVLQAPKESPAGVLVHPRARKEHQGVDRDDVAAASDQLGKGGDTHFGARTSQWWILSSRRAAGREQDMARSELRVMRLAKDATSLAGRTQPSNFSVARGASSVTRAGNASPNSRLTSSGRNPESGPPKSTYENRRDWADRRLPSSRSTNLPNPPLDLVRHLLLGPDVIVEAAERLAGRVHQQDLPDDLRRRCRRRCRRGGRRRDLGLEFDQVRIERVHVHVRTVGTIHFAALFFCWLSLFYSFQQQQRIAVSMRF
jgi:hypothetical protein